jgi:hypothetical protein
MMENKYYTPSIEEFHVGFEYEFREGTIWMKREYHPSHGLAGRILKDLVRVKYLDREDIESLGFKYLKDNRYEIHSNPRYAVWEMKVIDEMEQKRKGRLITDKDVAFRITIDFFHPDSKGETWFYGTIKNKSELKKLLKQIGV